jgi:peptidoglycan/xylan/chitin deacetylase (PgdA/CDA1 family)
MIVYWRVARRCRRGSAAACRDDLIMNETVCLAVTYHYVLDRSGAFAQLRGVDREAFAAQLDVLSAALEPIDWPKLCNWLRGPGAIPRRAFLLTFDDGLAMHAEIVAPLLESRGLRGTFFVCGQPLATARMLPAHQIHRLQHALGEEGFAAAVMAAMAGAAAPRDATTDQKIPASGSHARARLNYLLTQSLAPAERDRMLDALFERHVGDARDWAARWYLHAAQLAALQAAGHTIGAHGFRHEPYVRLTAQEQRRDIERSAECLSARLGRRARPFAYPYGYCDPTSQQACHRAGFVQAFTTEPVWIEPHSNAHALGRVDTIALDAFLEQEVHEPSSPAA